MGVQKIRVRSDNSHLAWGYPPFLGRSTKGSSGVARKPVGDELGESRSAGGWIRWIPEEAGVLARKVSYARKVLPARKARVSGRTCRHGKGVLRRRDCRRCGNSLAGIGIWTMIYVINCTA